MSEIEQFAKDYLDEILAGNELTQIDKINHIYLCIKW